MSQHGFNIETRTMGYRFERMSVMVVDDNRHMLNLISEILRGLSIRQVLRLIDPVDAFKEMLNGIEFTQLVRPGKDSPNPFVPVIMVTGYDDVATVTSARDAGVTEFLIKPISAKTLYLRVLEAINKPRSFIRTQSLFGPDRRRQVLPFKGPDRRVQAPMEIPDADHVARLYPINPQE